MKIYLESNSDSNNETLPYTANIEISTISIDFDTQFQIPIYQHKNGKTKFEAEICGFQLEGDSPDVVVSLIGRLIPQLVNMARLPTYVFIARRSHQMYPVYTFNDKVFATTPGGPLFEHVELAKVREYLSDYMHTIGALGVPGKSEKLHVRGVHRKTLALVRPLFYLKKRDQTGTDNEFWAPVFPSKDGELIYAYAANGRREMEVDNGHEVFRLRAQVGQALIADKRLKNEDDLRADRLLPEYWEKVKPHLKALPDRLVFNDTKFETFQEGKKILALEYRKDEDRYSFYSGSNLEDLRTRAAADLTRRGIIGDPGQLKIVT